MPPSKRSREQVDYLHRNPQMDPKRHQANMAIRRDHGVFGLARREALHADTKTGVLSLQLDCAEACSELAEVMRKKDPDSYFSITIGGAAPRTQRFPGYGNYDLLGVGGEDTRLEPYEQVAESVRRDGRFGMACCARLQRGHVPGCRGEHGLAAPPCPTPRQEKVTAMIQGDDLPQARIHLPCLDTIISDLNCKLGYLDEDIALINLIWQGSRQVRPVRR